MDTLKYSENHKVSTTSTLGTPNAVVHRSMSPQVFLTFTWSKGGIPATYNADSVVIDGGSMAGEWVLHGMSVVGSRCLGDVSKVPRGGSVVSPCCLGGESMVLTW